jgi:Glycosyltransferase
LNRLLQKLFDGVFIRGEVELTSVRLSDSDVDLVVSSGLFSAEWYCRMYSDVAEYNDDPLHHYLLHGIGEERDPGPHFSSSAYLYRYPDVEQTGIPSVLHYLRLGRKMGRICGTLRKSGRRPLLRNRPTVLVAAHSAGKHLFGGERSFLDVLDALVLLNINVIATVPDVRNRDYIDAVAARVHEVRHVPCPGWSLIGPNFEWAVDEFQRIIKEHSVRAVHVNTIALREPLIAAKRIGIPAIVHAREIPEGDPTLCQSLGGDADEVVSAVAENADLVIANSHATAACYARRVPVEVVYNLVRVEDFRNVEGVRATPNRIALISSNVEKKGVADFFLIASALEEIMPELKFFVIGPETDAVRQLSGNKPRNLIVAGYASNPQEAIGQADFVVNLSKVPESFGRSIAEAMAAGRPVLAYDWGGVSELIVNGKTGYLVPPSNVVAAVACIKQAFVDPKLFHAMGAAGRALAQERFGLAPYVKSLGSVYQKALSLQ